MSAVRIWYSGSADNKVVLSDEFAGEVTVHPISADLDAVRARASAPGPWNSSSGCRIFAIGNHVAFNLPLTPKGQAGKVTFASSCQDEIVRDGQSLPTGEVRRWRHATDTVALAEIQAIPAISLANCGRAARVRLDDPSGLAIELTHRADRLPKMPVVQFNLYGGSREGFFSPEPWVGLQGGHESGQGLTRLAPGESWRWRIAVRPARK